MPKVSHRIPGGGHVVGIRAPSGLAVAVPASVAEYTALGFPANTKIWDMASTSLSFPELIDGTPVLESEGGNSAGWLFEQASGLPNGELVAARATTNTSRSLASIPTSFMDLGSAGRVTVGMMVRFSSFAGTNIVANKRTSLGWNCQVNSSGQPLIFGRPDTGGDISVLSTDGLSLNTWHYLIFDLDHTSKLFSVLSDVGSVSASSAGKGSFANLARQFGFDAGNVGQTDIAAFSVWVDAVGTFAADLPGKFLAKAGV